MEPSRPPQPRIGCDACSLCQDGYERYGRYGAKLEPSFNQNGYGYICVYWGGDTSGYYTKPQKITQSPGRLYKAPRILYKALKRLYKAPKDYTKT